MQCGKERACLLAADGEPAVVKAIGAGKIIVFRAGGIIPHRAGFHGRYHALRIHKTAAAAQGPENFGKIHRLYPLTMGGTLAETADTADEKLQITGVKGKIAVIEFTHLSIM